MSCFFLNWKLFGGIILGWDYCKLVFFLFWYLCYVGRVWGGVWLIFKYYWEIYFVVFLLMFC